MSYKTCSDCGWSMWEGNGDDRVRWFPLFGAFICGECERNIGHRNIVRAVNGRARFGSAKRQAQLDRETPEEVTQCQATLDLFSDYDEHGNTR